MSAGNKSEVVERVAKATWGRRREVARAAGIELDPWEDELEALREEVRAETRVTIAAYQEIEEVE